MIRPLLLVIVVLLGLCMLTDAHGDHDHDHEHHHDHHHGHHDDHDDDDVEESTVKTADVPKLDPEEVEYHKGSLCGYCEYCKVPLLGYTLCFRKKHPLLFSCITLRKSNQFE